MKFYNILVILLVLFFEISLATGSVTHLSKPARDLTSANFTATRINNLSPYNFTTRVGYDYYIDFDPLLFNKTNHYNVILNTETFQNETFQNETFHTVIINSVGTPETYKFRTSFNFTDCTSTNNTFKILQNSFILIKNSTIDASFELTFVETIGVEEEDSVLYWITGSIIVGIVILGVGAGGAYYFYGRKHNGYEVI